MPAVMIEFYMFWIGLSGVLAFAVTMFYLSFLDRAERYSDGRPTAVSFQEREGWNPVQEHFLEDPRLH